MASGGRSFLQKIKILPSRKDATSKNKDTPSVRSTSTPASTGSVRAIDYTNKKGTGGGSVVVYGKGDSAFKGDAQEIVKKASSSGRGGGSRQRVDSNVYVTTYKENPTITTTTPTTTTNQPSPSKTPDGVVTKGSAYGGGLPEQYNPTFFEKVKQSARGLTNFGAIGQQGFGAYKEGIVSPFSTTKLLGDIYGRDFRYNPRGTYFDQPVIDTSNLTLGQQVYYQEIGKGSPFNLAGTTQKYKSDITFSQTQRKFQSDIDTGKISYSNDEEVAKVNADFEKEFARKMREINRSSAKTYTYNPLKTAIDIGTIGAVGIASTNPVGATIVGSYYAGTSSRNVARGIYGQGLTTGQRVGEFGIATAKIGFGSLSFGIGLNQLSKANIRDELAFTEKNPLQLTGNKIEGTNLYRFTGSSGRYSSALKQYDFVGSVKENPLGYKVTGGFGNVKTKVYDFVSGKTYTSTEFFKGQGTFFDMQNPTISKQFGGLKYGFNSEGVYAQEGFFKYTGTSGRRILNLAGAGKQTSSGTAFFSGNIKSSNLKVSNGNLIKSFKVKVGGYGIIKDSQVGLGDEFGTALGSGRSTYFTSVTPKSSSNQFMQQLYKDSSLSQSVATRQVNKVVSPSLSATAFGGLSTASASGSKSILSQASQSQLFATPSAFAGTGQYERTQTAVFNAPRIQEKSFTLIPQSSLQITKVDTIPVTIPIFRGGSGGRSRGRSGVTFFQPIPQVTSQSQSTSTTFASPTIPVVTTPFVPPTFTPFIPFGFGDLPKFSFDDSFRTRRIKGKKQPKRYTPDYRSLILGIRGRQPKRTITGLESRPIPKGFRFYGRLKL